MTQQEFVAFQQQRMMAMQQMPAAGGAVESKEDINSLE
jgi:hypothetical protein